MFNRNASSANRRRSRKSSTKDRGEFFASSSKTGSSRRKPTAKRAKRNLDDESEMLHAKIGELEDFIVGSPFRERHSRFKTRDTVPPPERVNRTSGTSRRRQPTRSELEARRNDRMSHLFTFVCLFAAVCAMLYWLVKMVE